MVLRPTGVSCRMPLTSDVAQLREHLREIDDLNAVSSLLTWDQSTYMPRGGGRSRGRHMATLRRLAHERQTHPDLLRLVARLVPVADDLSPIDRDLVHVVARDVDRATRLPGDFVAALTEHTVVAYEAWVAARARDDFGAIAPLLERTVELSRTYASYYPEVEHPADALIATADEGMTVATLRPLFAQLREALVPLVERVAESGAAAPALPVQGPAERQLELALRLAQAFGYDIERGRQDLAPHPFAIRMAHGDVRITTRVDPTDVAEALYSTLHEAGHALYEQGVDEALDGTPLASGVSAGVHESQSRLWENLVGRSRAFWSYALPIVQERFPELAELDVESAYRAVNRVQRSAIRTEADELTYNLHVVIRFELELELLEGRLSVGDLPAAWRDRYAHDLGVEVTSDADGVLQDVHWFGGAVGGAFQGYTIGNVLSAQCFDAARRDLGDVDGAIARGDFAPLHAWLRERLYAWGRRLPPAALIERATGAPLGIEPYLRYLRGKYLPFAAAGAVEP